jgi:hypothetical protein
MLLSSLSYAQTGILADDHMVKLVETKFGIKVDSMNFSPGLIAAGILQTASNEAMMQYRELEEGKEYLIAIFNLPNAGVYGSYSWMIVVVGPEFDTKNKRRSLIKLVKRMRELPMDDRPALMINGELIEPRSTMTYLENLRPKQYLFHIEHKFVNQQLYSGAENGMIELIIKE